MAYNLERFRSAHAESYETALREIREGRKQSHWMWYIFPQIQGLGHSTMAMRYEIQSAEEAMEYWNDPLLRGHMVEICRELLKLKRPIIWIMGYTDHLKLRSCMTLFWLVTGQQLFKDVLDQFYGGKLDKYTKEKLT